MVSQKDFIAELFIHLSNMLEVITLLYRLKLKLKENQRESSASVTGHVLRASEVAVKDEPGETAARAEAKSPDSTRGTESTWEAQCHLDKPPRVVKTEAGSEEQRAPCLPATRRISRPDAGRILCSKNLASSKALKREMRHTPR